MNRPFAILARRKSGGYSVMATCRCERAALKLARKLSRVLHSPSRVYSPSTGQIYCGDLKRWVRMETAIVADGQLALAIDNFSTLALTKGLDQIQTSIS